MARSIVESVLIESLILLHTVLMKLTRTFRLFTALVAILSVLFMQHAVAAYLCPGASMGAGSTALMMKAMPDMPGCTGMDTDQSTLCHVYSQGDAARQSLDKPPAVGHPAFVPVVMMLSLAIFDLPVLQPVDPPAYIALARPVAPPIAIRNCCFRI
jgi:hypothetical protein